MMRYLIVAIALAPAWSAASAQDGRDLRVRIGAGAELRPEYPGADKDKAGPLFDVSIAHGTDPFKFKAPDDSGGIALVNSRGFSFGPAANLVGSRNDSDVGAPVGRVGPTVEVGAFAGYRFDNYRVRAELLKGIGGHKGVRGELAVDRIWRDGDRYVFSLGPRVLFSDSQYERAFFGVTPTAALATGLPAFRPNGGIYGIAAASGLTVQLGDHWGLFGYARYERLIGDAAKSPIVRQYGSRNQVSAGLGLSYTFTVKRGSRAYGLLNRLGPGPG
jgi:outer membrane protein